MQATTQIVHYKVRQKQAGKYPVKLRIIYARAHMDIKLGIDLTDEEFADATSLKPSKKLRPFATKIVEARVKAEKVIAGMPVFTFQKFKAAFTGFKKDASDIYPFFEQYIKELVEREQAKTAISYRTAMNAIKKFHGRSKLNIYDITPNFLHRFQKWMVDDGKSVSTVGIYLRSLRAVYNYCVSKGVVKKDEHYPFGRHTYTIPAARNVKKALSREELKKIFEYEPILGTFEDRAKDFWVFSYLCSGINFKDIAHLKWDNIDGDMLRFVREKTKNTGQGNQKVISCYLTDQAKAIIKKWGNPESKPDGYIFPIIEQEDSNDRKVAKIDQFIQNTNKNMKRISKALGLSREVTTYYSRHSAATMLKRAGASIIQIQEALGHSSPMVTQKYLDSFEDESKKELGLKLLKNIKDEN